MVYKAKHPAAVEWANADEGETMRQKPVKWSMRHEDDEWQIYEANPDAGKKSVSYAGQWLRVAEVHDEQDARLMQIAPEMRERLELALELFSETVWAHKTRALLDTLKVGHEQGDDTMRRFDNWKEAHEIAQTLANDTHLTVLIRRVKEFGRVGYHVGFGAPYEDGERVDPQSCNPIQPPTFNPYLEAEAKQLRRDELGKS